MYMVVADGSCRTSPLATAHTLPRNHTNCHSFAPRPQLCRDGRTPVHLFMEYNQNVTAEVVELLHGKLGPEAFSATDE